MQYSIELTAIFQNDWCNNLDSVLSFSSFLDEDLCIKLSLFGYYQPCKFSQLQFASCILLHFLLQIHFKKSNLKCNLFVFLLSFLKKMELSFDVTKVKSKANSLPFGTSWENLDIAAGTPNEKKSCVSPFSVAIWSDHQYHRVKVCFSKMKSKVGQQHIERIYVKVRQRAKKNFGNSSPHIQGQKDRELSNNLVG